MIVSILLTSLRLTTHISVRITSIYDCITTHINVNIPEYRYK